MIFVTVRIWTGLVAVFTVPAVNRAFMVGTDAPLTTVHAGFLLKPVPLVQDIDPNE
jgi:hypothetical protein